VYSKRLGSRVGCGGFVARAALIMMVGIVALICVANRSWFESKILNAMYGHRPEIHLGKQFRPGSTAVEDGVRQTAIMIRGVPHVRVTAPTAAWRRHHQDAVCTQDACTAQATAKWFPGAAGVGLGGLLAALLAGYIVWTVLVGDDNRYSWSRY
jgi:hypothetical protein